MALKTTDGAYIKVEPLTDSVVGYTLYGSEQDRIAEKNAHNVLSKVLEELLAEEQALRAELASNPTEDLEARVDAIVSFRRDCKALMLGGDVLDRNSEGDFIVPLPPLQATSFTKEQVRAAVVGCCKEKIPMQAALANDTTASGAYQSFKSNHTIPGDLEDC